MDISLVYYVFRLYFYCQYTNNNMFVSKVNIMKYNYVVKFIYNFYYFTLKCDRFHDVFYNDFFKIHVIINLLNVEW